MVLSKKFKIRNKLDLSIILEKIEVKQTELDVVKILDDFHSQSNGNQEAGLVTEDNRLQPRTALEIFSCPGAAGVGGQRRALAADSRF